MAANILIVDDDLTIRKVLRTLLERAGYQIEEAVNGEEALLWCRRTPFDLITMDMSMGKIDGVDTIAILQNEINTPIVVISAHLNREIRQELSRRKIKYFLPKPFTQSAVIETIHSALTQS